MDKITRRGVNSFINRSFRDVADADYICARFCFRLDLHHQFLWASMQAVEKYLKAILLYNDQDTKDIGHSVYKAYSRLSSIGDINFNIPGEIEVFLRYLDRQGGNRYFEYPFAMSGNELLMLDATVWFLRRYCRHMPREKNWLKRELARIHDPVLEAEPNRFVIFSGYLEKVLKDQSSPARRELVLKNFYYGSKAKRHIRDFAWRSASGTPSHFLQPSIFDELEKRVRFTKPVSEYFKEKKASSLTKLS